MARKLTRLGTLAFSSLALVLSVTFASSGEAASLKEAIARIKPSIVGVGTYQESRRPPAKFLGTGFVVQNGRMVVTAGHVVPKSLDHEHRERLVVFLRNSEELAVRGARILETDKIHDVAILAIEGAPLPALALENQSTIAEGDAVAFTGFPLGSALGLHPVTHRGIISSITPFASQALLAKQLDAHTIRSLRREDVVYQLDATAYPGNSGSPVYLTSTGQVIGIVNSTFVKRSKEYALTAPSGISYAIPITHAQRLLEKLLD